MRRAAIAIAVGLSGLLGCSSQSNPASGDDDASVAADTSGLVGCDDPLVETYAPNMSQAGASSVFTFALVSSTPAPPADETNVFVIQVLDASGKPVTGAQLTAVATMPKMSHGTSAITVTQNADGSYTLTPLYFFMAGLWEVAITATSGSQKDTTSFYFCVPG